MVYALRIVKLKIDSKPFVEHGDVVKKNVGMVVDIFLLKRSVQPFTVSVHLGCLWIGMEMDDLSFTGERAEMFLKLTSIVGQHMAYVVREQGGCEMEKVSSGC